MELKRENEELCKKTCPHLINQISRRQNDWKMKSVRCTENSKDYRRFNWLHSKTLAKLPIIYKRKKQENLYK